jgi:hypothetical protein
MMPSKFISPWNGKKANPRDGRVVWDRRNPAVATAVVQSCWI